MTKAAAFSCVSSRGWRLLRLPMILFLGLVCLWLWIAQPLAGGGRVIGDSGYSDATELASRLEAHTRMLSETFAPRSYLHTANLARCAAYIADAWTAAGGSVSRQAYTVNGRVYENIRGHFGPVAGPRVIVGAHYDAFGALPGADDNACGVAGLIELGRAFGAVAPSGAVELVAFTLEEPPFFQTDEMGSRRHAAMIVSQQVEVAAMLCLEMIGYFSDAPGSQRYPVGLLRLFYPSRGNFIGVIGHSGQGRLIATVRAAMRATGGVPVRSIRAPATLPGVDLSDHSSYWRHGLPALMITDTAYLRNTAYHTPADRAERLDYNRMAHVVRGVEAAVRQLVSRSRR